MLKRTLQLSEKHKSLEEKYYLATQWQLMGRKFKKHKLGITGSIILLLFYVVVIFADLFSIYGIDEDNADYLHAPPQRIRFFSQDGFRLRPFVYEYKIGVDEKTWRNIYIEDTSKKTYIQFFVRRHEYKLLGLLPTNIHLLGIKEGTLFLFGTDKFGRDLFSRVIYASRISLTIGLVGVAISFFLGILFGGVSGYFGGAADTIIQRLIEFLISIPTIPLWMSLAAALPASWNPIHVYFGITIILSFVGWCGLARVVRGKFLELREADFTMAAKISGLNDSAIIAKHMVPSFLSYLIVNLTLAIPGMILGETALSFLGLGIKPPSVSWGALLKDAQQLSSVALYPWLLIPGVFVIIAVLAFNFLGDALRDAADPYSV